jgi:hypothetical protein
MTSTKLLKQEINCLVEKRLEKHQVLAKKEIFRLIKELDAEALKTMMKTEEHETLEIHEDNTGRKRFLGKLA